MIDQLAQIELPVCEHRQPHNAQKFFCTHPKVFTPGFLVGPDHCIDCAARTVAASPRSNHLPVPYAPDSLDDGRRSLSLRRRAATWLAAMARWLSEGSPVCTDEEQDYRRGICWQCDHLKIVKDKPRCNLCGCCLGGSNKAWNNKLKMATEQCPAKEPRWWAIDRQGEMVWYRSTAAVFLRLASKLLR